MNLNPQENYDSASLMFSRIPGRQAIPLRAWYPEFNWYYPDCEMQTKEWFVKHAERDWIYLDVGANVGVYAILFAMLSPQGMVYAFEPTATYDMLVGNINFNGIGNVISHNMAVGNKKGDIDDRIFRIWGREAERKIYPFTTIDAFIYENGATRLDVIKIDVDSFDFEVLQGAEETLTRFDPFVMVEINTVALSKRDTTPNDVFAWLREHGYANYHVFDGENYLLRRKNNFITAALRPLLPINGLSIVSKADISGRLEESIPSITWTDSQTLPCSPADDDLADAPALRYLFRHFKPRRHLEFGTWKGKGACRVIEESPASVWTLNLWEGEDKADGSWAYAEKDNWRIAGMAERDGVSVRTDARGMIGLSYLEAGLGCRVNQIYADSRLWDDEAYPDCFFDSAFVDGGHDAATARADLYKALRLLRPGGLLLLHDFCPLPEVNAANPSTVGVTAMAAAELDVLRNMTSDLFWIEDTWILCGVRRAVASDAEREKEAAVFNEARETGRRLALAAMVAKAKAAENVGESGEGKIESETAEPESKTRESGSLTPDAPTLIKRMCGSLRMPWGGKLKLWLSLGNRLLFK